MGVLTVATFTDKEMEDNVSRIRKAEMDQGRHPLDVVTEFFRQHGYAAQFKRLYGCADHKQAAWRATHGDAFRMK